MCLKIKFNNNNNNDGAWKVVSQCFCLCYIGTWHVAQLGCVNVWRVRGHGVRQYVSGLS